MALTRQRVTDNGPITYPDAVRIWERYDPPLPNDPVQVSQTYSVSTGTEVTTCNDVVTPNYKRRSAAGEIFNNDFYRKTEVYTPNQPSAMSMAYIKADGNGAWSGSQYSGTYVCPTADLEDFLVLEDQTAILDEIDRLQQIAVTSAHANASALELSVLMVAGEAHKTVGSMVAIARRANKVFRAVKRLDIQYLRKQISRKELEDRYMELRYALRPIVYDMVGTLKAIEQSKAFKTARRTARSFEHIDQTVTDTVPYTGEWSGIFDPNVVTRSIRYNASIRAGVLCDVTTSTSNVWGTDSWITTAWELVPFSFVLDWFVNVGDTIAAWTPKTGVKELASWVSIKGTCTWTNSFDLQGFNYSPEIHDVAHYASFAQKKTKVITFNRRFANPSLSVYPTVSVNLNPLKLLDLAIIGKKLRRTGTTLP